MELDSGQPSNAPVVSSQTAPPRTPEQAKTQLIQMLSEIQQNTLRPAPILSLDPFTHKRMTEVIQEFKNYIVRIDTCLEMFFVMTRDEEHTRRYLKHQILLSYSFDFEDPNLVLVEKPTLSLETLEFLLVDFRTLVASVLLKVREEIESRDKDSLSSSNELAQVTTRPNPQNTTIGEIVDPGAELSGITRSMRSLRLYTNQHEQGRS